MQGLDEFAFGHFLGRAFDHDDIGLIADVNEVEVALLALRVGGVGDELAVDATDAHRADGTREGNVGDAEGGGGTVHAQDVGVILAVGAEQERDDLGIVEITLREKRPQGAVGHPAGEDFFFGRPAFAFEVAAREQPGGGGLFLVFNREREKVLPGFEFGGRNSRHDDDGFAHLHGHGTVSQTGDFTGFDDDVGGADAARHTVGTHGFLVFFSVCCLGGKNGLAPALPGRMPENRGRGDPPGDEAPEKARGPRSPGGKAIGPGKSRGQGRAVQRRRFRLLITRWYSASSVRFK
jgi:hypothetical protein